MATITLTGGTFGCTMGMGVFEGIGVAFTSAKSSSSVLSKALGTLKSKIDLAAVAAKVEISQEQAKKAEERESTKKSSLSLAYEKLNTLIFDTGLIDMKASGKIRERKDAFYDRYNYLKPECEKGLKEKAKDVLKKGWDKFCDIGKAISNICIKISLWFKECWEEILLICGVAVTMIVLLIFTWPISGFAILAATTLNSIFLSVDYVARYFVPQKYDCNINSGESMAACLEIEYQSFLEAMKSQYGFDESFSKSYLKLYINLANSHSMRGKSQEELAFEFNRIVASLCLNYNGDAKRWKLTTGNYDSVEAFNMLIDMYGFSRNEAVDFTLSINIQHGSSYENVEETFGFSRYEGNLFINETIPSVSLFEMAVHSYGNDTMRDFAHEAIQYVEFNDDFDLVDLASGSTDRMISYSGDIVSGRYDNSDFLSDIIANNIQRRFNNSSNNFIAVQQQYNEDVHRNHIDPKNDFILNNEGIDKIRENIDYDIMHTLAAYIDRGNLDLLGDSKNRLEYHKSQVDDFISFLQNK